MTTTGDCTARGRRARLAVERDGIYLDARQQWAEKSARDFLGKSYFNLAGKTEDVDQRIIQIVGHAAHNDSTVIANSGRHAAETRAFIEDQPDISVLVWVSSTRSWA